MAIQWFGPQGEYLNQEYTRTWLTAQGEYLDDPTITLVTGAGSSAGTTTATATGVASNAQAGSSAGSATDAGVGAAQGAASGASAGSATAAAIGAALAAGTGSASGVSVASGGSSVTAAGAGAGAGTSAATAVGSYVATQLIGRKSRHYKRRLYDFEDYSPESLAGNPEVLGALVAEMLARQGALVRDILSPFRHGSAVDTERLASEIEVIRALRNAYVEEIDERFVEDELLLL